MTKIVEIEGMNCGHCVMAVKKELTKLDLEVKEVVIGKAELDIADGKLNEAEIIAAVEEAGFSVKSIS